MSRDAVWSELYDDSNGLVRKIVEDWNNKPIDYIEGNYRPYITDVCRARELFQQMYTFENNDEDKKRFIHDKGEVDRISYQIEERGLEYRAEKKKQQN
jgi:hypothetical protein